MANETENVEALSCDVVAFCALLARILQRSLAEQDARMLSLLSLPSTSVTQDNEVAHESVARSC